MIGPSESGSYAFHCGNAGHTPYDAGDGFPAGQEAGGGAAEEGREGGLGEQGEEGDVAGEEGQPRSRVVLLPRGRASLAVPGAILLFCHTLRGLGSGLILFWLRPHIVLAPAASIVRLWPPRCHGARHPFCLAPAGQRT